VDTLANLEPRPATAADLEPVTEAIRLAFASDPVWGRVFPAGAGRDVEVAALWRLWIEGALRYGWVWMTPGAEAAAVWIPPGGTDLSAEQEARVEELAVRALGTTGAAYFEAVIARFTAAHPHGEPHYYLSLLATDPAHRGRGLGIGLLADNLARIDKEGRAAYLESTNPANNDRYGRQGFERFGQFDLPGDGPTVTTMWRTGRDPVSRED
jgi:GNAT superfamily N-acetyltransferase